MTGGERRYVFAFFRSVSRLAAVRPAKLQIKRLFRDEGPDVGEATLRQDRRLERELRREPDRHLRLARRRAALVVDQPRPARGEPVDSIGARGQLERLAVAERKDDLASTFDKDVLGLATGLVLEPDDEIDRLLNVGPVQAGKGSIPQQLGKAIAREAAERLAGCRWQQTFRERPGEILQRPVPGLACLAGPERLINLAERREPENPLGVDGVRIAAQRLDPGDAQRARTLLDRRRRRGPLHGRHLGRPVERAPPGEVFLATPLGLLDRAQAGGGSETLQEARGDGRLAAALFGATQNHLARAERGGEVVRRLADPPLGRRKPEARAHRPVEERVCVDGWRPDLLVQAGDEDAIEGEKARFEQAEDGETRMPAGPRRGAHPGERLLQQAGVVGERAGKSIARGQSPFVEESVERYEPVGRLAIVAGRRKDGRERRAMRNEPIAERRGCGRAEGP